MFSLFSPPGVIPLAVMQVFHADHFKHVFTGNEREHTSPPDGLCLVIFSEINSTPAFFFFFFLSWLYLTSSDVLRNGLDRGMIKGASHELATSRLIRAPACLGLMSHVKCFAYNPWVEWKQSTYCFQPWHENTSRFQKHFRNIFQLCTSAPKL